MTVRRFLAGIGAALATAAHADSGSDEVLVRGERLATTASAATLLPTPLFDLPFSASVLDTADFAERQPKDLADLADYAAGVSRRANYWGVNTPTFQLRGFNAGDASAYYKDGFRYQARGPVSLANIERVEILRGPQAALYGWAEPGGAAHLVSKQPTRQPLRRLSAQADAWGRTVAGADLGGAVGTAGSFRLVLGNEHGGSFRDRQRLQQTLLAPSLAYDFADGRRLLLASEWLDDRRSTDYGIPAVNGAPARVPVDRIYTEDWGRQHSRSTRHSMRWEQPAADGRLALAVAHYTLQYLTYHDAEPYAVAGTTISRWYERYPERYRWLTAYLDWSREFAGDDLRHHFSTRLEIARETRSLVRGEFDEYPAIDVFAPVYGQTYVPTADFSVFDQRWRNHSLGLVLQDEIRAGNWTWLAGMRLGHLRQDFDYADHLPLPSRLHRRQRDTSLTPRIGVSWRARPWLSVYANHSTGSMPTLPQSRTFDGGSLSPVRGRQTEGGVKIQPADGGWLASLAAFDIVRENVPTRDPVHPGYSIQTGEQRSRGLEMDWQGRLAPRWQLTAQATWLAAEIRSDQRYAPGNRLPYAPRFGASAWLRHTLPATAGGHWQLAAGIVHQGRRHADFANTVSLPSYQRVDAGVTWHAARWAATLAVENLGDRRYYASGVENRPAVIYPGAPRTLSLRLSVDH